MRMLSFAPSEAPRIRVFYYEGKAESGTLGPHGHRFFELVFLEEAKGWHVLEGRRIRASAGDLFLIAPGEIHDMSGLTSLKKWIVAFGADALEPGRSDADVFLMLP